MQHTATKQERCRRGLTDVPKTHHTLTHIMAASGKITPQKLALNYLQPALLFTEMSRPPS